MDSAYHSSAFEFESQPSLKLLKSVSDKIPVFSAFHFSNDAGSPALPTALVSSVHSNASTSSVPSSLNSSSTSKPPNFAVNDTHSSLNSTLKPLNQSVSFVPKSSSLLMNQKWPDFSKAASWDAISETYNTRIAELITPAKPRGKPSTFPYLMQLGLGVKYSEWFEMQMPSHKVILHRELVVDKSTVQPSYCLLFRVSRV